MPEVIVRKRVRRAPKGRRAKLYEFYLRRRHSVVIISACVIATIVGLIIVVLAQGLFANNDSGKSTGYGVAEDPRDR